MAEGCHERPVIRQITFDDDYVDDGDPFCP